MPRIEIKHRWHGGILYVAEADDVGAAVKQAAGAGANLYGANLERANLDGANLAGANLDGANLDGANLERANLDGANLAGANLDGANLARASLACANLYGATLDGANLESANLDGTNLERANLYGANLESANLDGANLYGAHLDGANLESANLDGANLARASLDGATLDGATLATIPIVEKLDTKVLAAVTAEGGHLDMSHWHGSRSDTPVCGSTHCRAGWAIHLAGKPGYDLERIIGSSAAGALIYARSTGRPVPDFHCTDKEAMEDIRRCAELEAQSEWRRAEGSEAP